MNITTKFNPGQMVWFVDTRKKYTKETCDSCGSEKITRVTDERFVRSDTIVAITIDESTTVMYEMDMHCESVQETNIFATKEEAENEL